MSLLSFIGNKKETTSKAVAPTKAEPLIIEVEKSKILESPKKDNKRNLRSAK